MRRITISVAIILSCIVTCWSQAYYEASGQTQVFTLTSGAKSGLISVGHTAKINNDLKITSIQNAIVILLPGISHRVVNIAMYNISGRQIFCKNGYNGTTLRLKSGWFAPGIYTAIASIDGKNYSHLFAISK